MSGNADTNVSANDLFNGQQLLTYPIRIPEEGIPHASEHPFLISLPRTERPTPEGGRSESHTINAGFRASASVKRWDEAEHINFRVRFIEPVVYRALEKQVGRLVQR